jgi:hypothetical protein
VAVYTDGVAVWLSSTKAPRRSATDMGYSVGKSWTVSDSSFKYVSQARWKRDNARCMVDLGFNGMTDKASPMEYSVPFGSSMST